MFTPIGFYAAAAGGGIVTDNLQQWLQVETGTEGGTLGDSSGNGNNATKYGGSDILYDTVNKWWDITADDTDDRIDSEYQPANWLGSWTIECWINMTSLEGGACSIVGNRETAGTNFWILAANEGNGKIEIYWIGGGETAISPTPASSYFDSQWHHVVATHDGSTMKLYVDKTEVGSASTSGRTAPTNGNNLSLMGRYITNRWWDDALFGSYRLYSSDIGSAGITQNYDAEKSHYGL